MGTGVSRITRIELLYVALAVLGLFGSWAQVSGYLGHGLVAGNLLFWREAVATPAGTFLTVDVLVLAAALFVWIFAEGRRLGIGTAWLWGYFLASLLVAISCAVPLFLAHRSRRIRLHHAADAGAPAAGDWIAISVAIALALVAVAHSLRNAA